MCIRDSFGTTRSEHTKHHWDTEVSESFSCRSVSTARMPSFHAWPDAQHYRRDSVCIVVHLFKLLLFPWHPFPCFCPFLLFPFPFLFCSPISFFSGSPAFLLLRRIHSSAWISHLRLSIKCEALLCSASLGLINHQASIIKASNIKVEALLISASLVP